MHKTNSPTSKGDILMHTKKRDIGRERERERGGEGERESEMDETKRGE